MPPERKSKFVPRHLPFPTSLLLLAACVLFAACQSNDNARITDERPVNTAGTPATSTTQTTANNAQTGASNAPSGNAPLISPGHGGTAQPAAAASPSSAVSCSDKPEIDTSKLDAKIAAAEKKAKAARAGEAERRAAAEAFFERGYVYYSAQNPRLYKFALGDFRRVLRYQPDHAQAREIINQIEDIYRSMGRPIPQNGLEP